ncbi:MAG: hypothetical protein OXG07_08865 [Anaerolineaceae bacterium]|nr:hypothetical protein [Anaerolineaceae bacterium]
MDRRNGDDLAVELSGERYTLLQEHVLYFDLEDRRVRLVDAAGDIADHPFIQLPGATLRVDWLVSPDASRISWTYIEQGADGQLRSFTRVSDIQGDDIRDVLVDGPRPNRHAVPVAFGGDGATLFMDYRPLLQPGEAQRAGFAHLFALSRYEGFTRPLPDEPGCLCGAAFGAGQILRLQLAADLDGYELVQRDLNGDLRGRIAAPALPGFTAATHLLAAPDGSRALYTLSQQRGGSDGGGQAVRSVFVLADLEEGSSLILGEPVRELLRPVSWSDGDNTVILTSDDPLRDGTWKLDLTDGALLRVARATWLGALAN